MSEPKILYVAPLRDFSGYATAARNYVRALDSVGANLVTRNLSYDGGAAAQTEREAEIANGDVQGVDIVVQHTTPNETHAKPGVFNVNYFAWETDRVPDEWAEKLNQMDLVLVPCDENLKAARRAGVNVPIEKIHHTFDESYYDKGVAPYLIDGLDDHFKFLAICQISKKKGLDALLKGFLSEFTADDKVALILKVYFGPGDTNEHRQRMSEQVDKMRQLLRLDNYPPVVLVHGVIDEVGIKSLYNTCDAYVLPSRGEGWGIPHFDAMGFGLPPIAVNWGGPTEFITEDAGWLVDSHMSPCFDMPHPHSFMYTGKDNWAEPHMDSLRAAMREAHIEWKIHQLNPDGSAWQSRLDACADRVKDFSYDKVGGQMKNTIMHYYEKWRTKNG